MISRKATAPAYRNGSIAAVLSIMLISTVSCSQRGDSPRSEHPLFRAVEICNSSFSKKARYLQKVTGQKTFIELERSKTSEAVENLSRDYTKSINTKRSLDRPDICSIYYRTENEEKITRNSHPDARVSGDWVEDNSYSKFSPGDRKESSESSISYPIGYAATTSEDSATIVFPCTPKGKATRKDRALFLYFNAYSYDIAPEYRKTLTYQKDKMKVLNAFALSFAERLKCTNNTLLSSSPDLTPIGTPTPL